MADFARLPCPPTCPGFLGGGTEIRDHPLPNGMGKWGWARLVQLLGLLTAPVWIMVSSRLYFCIFPAVLGTKEGPHGCQDCTRP
jgi:hypothetical protein